MPSLAIPKFWILEDTSGYVEREKQNGPRGQAPIAVRVYSVCRDSPKLAAQTSYHPSVEGRRHTFRTDLALSLLRQARIKSGIIVVTPRLSKSPGLLAALLDQN